MKYNCLFLHIFYKLSHPLLYPGYYTTDLPYPRGELWVTNTDIQEGFVTQYVGEETRMIVDENGYYHTGDIVELMPNERVIVIDRFVQRQEEKFIFFKIFFKTVL